MTYNEDEFPKKYIYCFHETGKVALSARIISPGIRRHRILHE